MATTNGNTVTDKARENNELLTMKLRYKEPTGFKSILMEEIVFLTIKFIWG